MFGFLKSKKKKTLTEKEAKWNKMWDLWVENAVASPYKELMTYDSEVNNGGHSQYFLNTENTGDIEKELRTLSEILSADFMNNLNKALAAYRELDEEENGKAEEILEECDSYFFDSEEEILKILEEFSESTILL